MEGQRCAPECGGGAEAVDAGCGSGRAGAEERGDRDKDGGGELCRGVRFGEVGVPGPAAAGAGRAGGQFCGLEPFPDSAEQGALVEEGGVGQVEADAGGEVALGRGREMSRARRDSGIGAGAELGAGAGDRCQFSGEAVAVGLGTGAASSAARRPRSAIASRS